MVFSNKWYDRLKFVAQIGLPALGTFWATVSGLYEWPNTEEVVGTIVALDLLLGTLLGLSTNKYNKDPDNFDGTYHVVQDGPNGIPAATFNMNKEPDEFGSQDKVIFKVVNSPNP